MASEQQPEALNALGNRALAEGRFAEARQLFENAVGMAPDQPALRFNLSAALRASGDLTGALDQLAAALSIDPYFVQAMFQKGVLLEELGRGKEAALVFRSFLDCAPEEVRASPQFQPVLEHARRAVAADNDALGQLIATRLGSSGEGDGSRRFEEAIDALVGRSRIYVAEPTFLTVPRLPAIPFFDRELIPWLKEIEAATDIIRRELLAVLGEGTDSGEFTPYVANPPGVPLNQWAELNHSPRWSAYHFWRHGERNDKHCAACPRTTALFDEMPLMRIARRGPNAFFSLLKPGTRIPPHTGVSNIRSTVHLPLIVPPGCGFRVGTETRVWQEGCAWVFDDTIEHEAWNDSDQPRFILIFDIWHPCLTGDEQRQFTTALGAFDEHYGGRVSWPDTL